MGFLVYLQRFFGYRLFLIIISCFSLHKVECKDFDIGPCRTYYNMDPPTPNDFYPACPEYKHKNGHNNGYKTTYKEIKIAYIDFPPYIYSDGNSLKPRGIFVDYVETFIKKACRNSKFVWNRYNFKTAGELQGHCRNNLHTCEMSVPTVGMRSQLITNRNEWAAFFSNMGVAYITIHVPPWEKILPKFTNDVIATWPFIALLAVFVFFSGVIIWALETTTSESYPKHFYDGIWNGIWWAFITMTTVGYGDRTPGTTVGRVYAVFWSIFGMAMFSVLTAVLANSLANAGAVGTNKIQGNIVGVLGTTKMAKEIVARNDGKYRVSYDINELVTWFQNKEIDGIAMDVRELEYHWKHSISKIPEVDLVFLETIHQYEKEFGISVYAGNFETEHWRKSVYHVTQPWDDCMRAYVSKNIEVAEQMETLYINTEDSKLDDSFQMPKETESFSLLHPDSDVFKEFLRVSLYIILAICVIGIVYEVVRLKWFRKKNPDDLDEGEDASDLTDAEKNSMTKEEKIAHKIVFRTIAEITRLIKEYEKNVMHELSEMSTTIRKQMKSLKNNY